MWWVGRSKFDQLVELNKEFQTKLTLAFSELEATKILLKASEDKNASLSKELANIRQWRPNIEAVAYAFNDMQSVGEGLLRLNRVDPDTVFEWGSKKR